MSVSTSSENDLSTRFNMEIQPGGITFVNILVLYECTSYLILRIQRNKKKLNSVQINLKLKVKRVGPNVRRRIEINSQSTVAFLIM